MPKQYSCIMQQDEKNLQNQEELLADPLIFASTKTLFMPKPRDVPGEYILRVVSRYFSNLFLPILIKETKWKN